MNKIRAIVLVLFFFGFLIRCKKNSTLFIEVPQSHSGIEFVNVIEDTEDLSILDYMYYYNGAGVAVGDINNDGLNDLFFTANKASNMLYINKGNLQFENISETSGITGKSTWNTGVSMVDINQDGWLDIYVCSVVGIHGFKGHNELYINQKDGTFKESASDYGLAIQNYSTSAAFFDFDKDGDLDLYLLNHGVHKTSTYGVNINRKESNEMSSDKLFENREGKFVDVTALANLSTKGIGFGLAVSIGDLNSDGWDDLYVSNDFYEDDYLYINQKDGTFKEEGHDQLSQTSQFSMGNDIADINHDGLLDIISLDMLPEDEKVLKSSLGEVSISSLRRKRQLGYQDQFPRNHLQINTGQNKFLEIGLLSNIAATDWSWAPLLADFDLDGQKDLFITNGIYRRPNDADYIKFISSDQIRSKISNTKLVDQVALEKMPSGSVPNYFFKGTKELRFHNMKSEWTRNEPIISNGAVSVDLDNDGDLDLVMNNFNTNATILENTLKSDNKHYLKIKFTGTPKNLLGIGTKVNLYSDGKMHFQQLHLTRGFLSSAVPELHFGLGTSEIDSLEVIWPDEKITRLKDVESNSTIHISYLDVEKEKKSEVNEISKKFEPFRINGLEHVHKELYFPEFDREKLMPYGLTQEGPAMAVADINQDGLQDIFIGGSKGFSGVLFMATSSGFSKTNQDIFALDKKSEDVDAVFTDIDMDGDLDLFVVSGGGEYSNEVEQCLDRVYLNDGHGNFNKSDSILPVYYHNGSVVKSSDIDNDGDIDYFVGSRSLPNAFGKPPKSFLLENNNGKLTITQNDLFQDVGMVTDGVFLDYDSDGDDDLFLTAEWRKIQLFENDKGKFKNVTNQQFIKNPYGLWQAATPFDVDKDGDLDLVVGNVGLNTKFRASSDYPLKMYRYDFDGNEKEETIVSMAKNGVYYPVDSKEKLSSQLDLLIKKKYTTANEFAGESITDIFGKKILSQASEEIVEELQSGYYKNHDGKFTFIPFDIALQWGPITYIEKLEEASTSNLIMGGSKIDLPPYQGLWNSQESYFFTSIHEFSKLSNEGISTYHQKVGNLKPLIWNDQPYFIIIPHNNPIQIFKINHEAN